MKSASVSDGSPLIFFTASVNRIGTYVDMESVARSVKKLYPEIHVWVDASQDSRAIPSADIVWYSKRFGESGQGLVAVRKDRYEHSISVFAIQSGYDLAHLAHLTAVLHACAQQDLVGVGVHELCYTPQRWEVDPWSCFRVSLQETLEEGIKYWRSSSLLKSLLILRQDVITSIHECFRRSILLLFGYFLF